MNYLKRCLRYGILFSLCFNFMYKIKTLNTKISIKNKKKIFLEKNKQAKIKYKKELKIIFL